MDLILSAGQAFMSALGINSLYVGYIASGLGIALVGLALAQFRK